MNADQVALERPVESGLGSRIISERQASRSRRRDLPKACGEPFHQLAQGFGFGLLPAGLLVLLGRTRKGRAPARRIQEVRASLSQKNRGTPR